METGHGLISLAADFEPCSIWSDFMSFGDRVRGRRKALGMTTTALAKLSRVGRVQITRIELTALEPRAHTIRSLAKALNVSADYLLELDDKPRRLPDG